jgi:folylpolyglutamate synthase/dihydropteroate synthase
VELILEPSSSTPRALAADELARLGAGLFEHVEAVPAPHRALERARALAGREGAVLVTGSLYLLADLDVRPGA